MSTVYDLGRTTVTDNLTQTVGSGLAARILAAIDEAAGGQSGDLKVVSDFTPGAELPPDTQLVVMDNTVSGNVGTLPPAPAIIFSGSAGVQVVLDGGNEQIVQFGAGSDVVRLTETAGNKFIDLGGGNDVFEGNGLGNQVVAGVGDKDIDLGGGNDALDITGSSGVFDGGTGFDTAYIDGKASDYSVSVVNGVLTLTNTATGQASNVSNLEYVKFSDGSVIINVQDDVDAAIARIYEVALDRSADASGINFWIDQNDPTGATTIALAERFLFSDEFTNDNGKPVTAMSDAEFLNIIYQKAFERAPETVGLQFWLDQLSQGMSRGEVVVRFAFESEAEVKFDGSINVIPTLQ